MIRTCPKCGAYYADVQLAFCFADGAPLVDVDPSSEQWREGSRSVQDKTAQLRKQRWWRVWRTLALSGLTTVLLATVFTRSFTVETTAPPPVTISWSRGPVCSDSDRERIGANLVATFARQWRRAIERERPQIVATAFGSDIQNAVATLGTIEFQPTLRKCSAAVIAARYAWQVKADLPQGVKAASVPRVKRFACRKVPGEWICN
jgi:hypothetical protein